MSQNHSKLARYLFILATAILLMVLIGGLTRLTGSGLSIVEWQLFTGILPPLGDNGWQHLFKLYQQSPEFKQLNPFMTLSDFKSIFWLEYIHRLWGRCLGVMIIFITGFCWIKRDMRPYFKQTIIILILIILQGTLGWFMVKSGLKSDPHVSPFFLTAHLMLAVITLTTIIILRITVMPFNLRSAEINNARHPGLTYLCVLVTLTFIYGGLVAGHKAGLIYNEFPFMGGQVLPSELLTIKPIFYDCVMNPVTVQWWHRLLALLSWITINIWGIYNDSKFHSAHYKMPLIFVNNQVLLGIGTLLYHVPLVLAVSHQCVGTLLVTYFWVMRIQSRQARQRFSFQKLKEGSSPC